MKQLLVLLLLFAAGALYSQETDTTLAPSSGGEELTFLRHNLTGIGLWLGASTGAGASVRYTSNPKAVTLQFTGFVTATKEGSDHAFGMALMYPVLSYEQSRYLGYLGFASYSSETAPFRFGGGVVGEWMYWKRFSLNLSIDLFTYFSDQSFIIPLVSGGIYMYF